MKYLQIEWEKLLAVNTPSLSEMVRHQMILGTILLELKSLLSTLIGGLCMPPGVIETSSEDMINLL